MAVIEMKSRDGADLAGDEHCRMQLEQEILPGYLIGRRWYDAKANDRPTVRIEQAIPIAGLDGGLILIVAASSPPDAPRRYQLPVRCIWDGPRPQHPLAELRCGTTAAGWLIDGFDEDAFVRALVDAIRKAAPATEPASGLAFRRSASLEADRFAIDAPVRRPGAEQSNTSVTLGGAMLKAFRKLETGTHPEVEVGEFLTDVAHFGNTPKLFGSIEYISPADGSRTLLGVLQALVENASDGWKWVLERLGRLTDGDGERQTNDLLTLARTLGRRTAELHRAFAAGEEPAFAPEPVSSQWLQQWSRDLSQSAERIFGLLDRSIPDGSRAAPDDLKALLTRRDECLDMIERHMPITSHACRSRLHGDFHLGQTLVANDDVFIVDFEGEPMRPLAERRGKYLPIRDVAGMLRSFDYARATRLRGPDPERAIAAGLDQTVDKMKACFLEAYGKHIAGAKGFPEDRAEADRFLWLCLVEKCLYEIGYELANRPDWVDIPMAGLLALLDEKPARPGGI